MPTFPFARLGAFRAELHACFTRRADALFELGDALLCTPTPVPSLPHLSLEPVHQRGWGSVYAALARGDVDAERLRDLLARVLPAADPPIFAVDVTTWPRCDAECSPERGYYYHPSRHSAGQPIIAGWAYQWICQLSFERDSWTAPVDARRLHPLEDTDQTAAAQILALLARLPASQAVPLFVFDGGYDSAQLTLDLADAPAAVLVRLRSGRCFYADPPPAARSPRGGRPRRHGARFNCANPTTWPAPTATLTCQDDQYGTVTVACWLALGVILVAAFMDLLDAGIVFLALPSIQQDLHASFASLQWVAAGYTLAFALVLITAGRLGDILGRKRLFLVGVAGFTVASAACAAAQSPEMLVASRVLQGAMAATMIPQILSIIQANFSVGERAAAFGLYGAVGGMANVAGPPVAGLLLQSDPLGLGWRSIFLINLPIGVATFAAAAVLVRESRAPRALRLDPVGVGIITVGLLLVLYPLVQGRELGWPTWTFAAMVAAVPVLAVFVLWERRKTRRDGSPLVALALFRQRPFVAGLGVNLALLAGIASFFLVLVFYLRVGLGFSAIKTALIALPWPVGIAVGAGISARFAATAGRRLLATGSLLVTVAMVLLVGMIDRYGITIHGWQLVPVLAFGGFGMGLVFPPLIDTVLAGVPLEDAGSASGVLNTAQQLGSAVGVAVIGVIFFGLLTSQAAPSAQQVVPGLRGGLEAAGVPTGVQQQVVAGFQACAAGVFLVAFLLSLLLPATPRPRQPEPDQQPTTVTA